MFDRFLVFGGTSLNLLMVGDDLPGYVNADGTRLGDLNLGGRIRLSDAPRLGEASYGALALQVGVTLPTARWISSSSQLSGESGVSVTPELLAEVGGESLR
ncbi:MAG: hypothetical protein AAB328_08830, partial [candidate division NC10 bacterium]